MDLEAEGPETVFDRLEQLIAETGRTLVHPFDDPLVLAGQGTVGLEIEEDVPDVDTVVVPIGGGGLIGGIAAALPDKRVVGVEPVGSNALTLGLAQNEPVPVSPRSIADGLNAPFAGELAIRIVREHQRAARAGRGGGDRGRFPLSLPACEARLRARRRRRSGRHQEREDSFGERGKGRCRRLRRQRFGGDRRCYPGSPMKPDIHPDYVTATVRCSCGNEFETRSTKPELHVEICSACHPFYTGKQKLMDTGGRVERFQRRLERAGGARRGFLLS